MAFFNNDLLLTLYWVTLGRNWFVEILMRVHLLIFNLRGKSWKLRKYYLIVQALIENVIDAAFWCNVLKLSFIVLLLRMHLVGDNFILCLVRKYLG